VVDPRLAAASLLREHRHRAGRVAFAGYGIVAPGNAASPTYDAYGDLDVNGGWVMLFRYLPGHPRRATAQHLAATSSCGPGHGRPRARRQRRHRVSGPNAGVTQELSACGSTPCSAGTSVAVVSVTDAAANACWRGPPQPEIAQGGGSIPGTRYLPS